MSQQWCSIQPWRLRVIMAERGMFATTDIVPRLAEGGTVPSRSQAHRLVARHSCTTTCTCCPRCATSGASPPAS